MKRHSSPLSANRRSRSCSRRRIRGSLAGTRLAARMAVLALVAVVAASCSYSDQAMPESEPAGSAPPTTRADLAANGEEPGTGTTTLAAGAAPGTEESSGGATTAAPTAPTEPVRDCSPRIPDNFVVAATDPTLAGIEVSQAAYPCAHEVGLAFASNPAAIATVVAAARQGPLLLVGDWFDTRLMGELERLAPGRIVAAGFDERVLAAALSAFDVDSVGVDRQARLTSDPETADRVWLVDSGTPLSPLIALGNQLGIGVVTVDGDIRAAGPETRDMITGATRVEMLSDFAEDTAWQLDVIRRGDEIPGGGLLMFDEGFRRRLVAVYGHPVTSALGVLGEQGPEEGIDRLRSIMSGYEADGAAVLPTFEIIATVASAGPGRDGNYSSETDRDVIRPWIEIAAANDVYVVLDLQPGRTDFLTQAKQYEEFLRLPHVGLALDPEWRLKPDQVHLRQIGTVDASEVNQVVEWLAGIVREEALPQKLLIVHQFRFSMITNRELIGTPPELAVLIQMDGQGSLGSKYNTWNALTGEPDADRLHWGWKNFYDEDSPMATPDQVLDLDPLPLFVSFQ